MGKNQFRFKQFAVDQDLCAMKVGTDGVLLGAWTDSSKARAILDVGTGTGLISLMMAQRNPTAEIHALDIDLSAFKQSTVNFARSPWPGRLSAIHADFDKYNPRDGYDLIVSNPPYFSKGLTPKGKSREAARMADFLPLRILVRKSAELLNEGGKLALILPAESEGEMISMAAHANLHPERITRVSPLFGRPPKRVLIEMLKEEKALITRGELAIESDSRHNYTEEYIELTKDFYLNFPD